MTIPVLKKFNYTTLAAYGITDAAPLSHVGSGGTEHATAVSAGAAGFMTGTDKAKLDGVATGATAYTDANARAAVIASTITNGDTTHAPSGDAVFDALSLKANISNFDN